MKVSEKFMCTGQFLGFNDSAKNLHDILCVYFLFFLKKKMDSELAPLSGVFQKYTGSSQDSISRAVDATQEEVCIES